MSFSLTSRDRAVLDGVHPHLVAVVERAAALTSVPFRVFEGPRTVEKQREYVRRGVSKTMNSRHIPGGNGYAHAVDLVLAFDVDKDGDIDGSDYWAAPGSPSGADAWRRLETAMKKAAGELGVPVEWGGDWRSFKDYPHWQLPWKSYPADKPVTQEARSGESGAEAGTADRGKSNAATGTKDNAVDGVYRSGDSGEVVGRYQAALKKLGYVIPTSGTMDDRTVFVVRVVQRQNDLEDDGVLGPRTMTAIDAMTAAAKRGEPTGAAQANADKEPPAAAPPVQEETDQAAAKKKAAVVGGSGAAASVALVAEPIQRVIEAVEGQTEALASGEIARMGVGLVIVGLTIAGVWKAIR